MQKFSERKGYTKVSTVIQKEGMTDELRNSLWNVLHNLYWSRRGYIINSNGRIGEIKFVSQILQEAYFKKPLDELPNGGHVQLDNLKNRFFGGAWHSVYDFLEFFCSVYPRDEKLTDNINSVLKRELSAFRIVAGKFTDITDEQEIEALEEAIGDEHFKGVSGHLKRALELLSDRQNPDYRNSIKESISAVESMAREIVGNEKDTLGKALVKLEKDGKIHKSLKDGFSKMYGYTSDEGGIRHAMMDDSDISVDDAKFFLLSCTSFINYLKTKM